MYLHERPLRMTPVLPIFQLQNGSHSERIDYSMNIVCHPPPFLQPMSMQCLTPHSSKEGSPSFPIENSFPRVTRVTFSVTDLYELIKFQIWSGSWMSWVSPTPPSSRPGRTESTAGVAEWRQRSRRRTASRGTPQTGCQRRLPRPTLICRAGTPDASGPYNSYSLLFL